MTDNSPTSAMQPSHLQHDLFRPPLQYPDHPYSEALALKENAVKLLGLAEA